MFAIWCRSKLNKQNLFNSGLFINLCHKLTLDDNIHWLADSISEAIGHVAPERSLVVAGHIENSEIGASVAELHSVAGCDLGAAVQPEEGERGPGGEAGQTDGAVELQQIRAAALCYCDIGDRHCGLKTQQKPLAPPPR